MLPIPVVLSMFIFFQGMGGGDGEGATGLSYDTAALQTAKISPNNLWLQELQFHRTSRLFKCSHQ